MLPLDDAYLEWLYSQVGPVDNKNLSTRYLKLTRLLYHKEFVWIDDGRGDVSHDENRAADGKALRTAFLRENSAYRREARASGWMDEPCDVLEMLIALAKKISYIDLEGRSTDDWFWIMIRNLELDIYTDATDVPPAEVYYVLDRVLNREYDADGSGGLFPIRGADVVDQRGVEIWYQANTYLLAA